MSGSFFEDRGVYAVNANGTTTYMMRGAIEGQAVNIPLNNTGFTYSGSEFNASYATRQAYKDLGAAPISYKDNLVDLIETSMQRGRTKSEVREAVKQLNLNVIDNMRGESSRAIGQAVWLPQQEFAHSGVRAKSWLLQQQAVYAGGGKVDLAFLEKAAREAKRTGKFPSVRPDV
jgi:hypothetical protein